jgi:hypothetical protein
MEVARLKNNFVHVENGRIAQFGCAVWLGSHMPILIKVCCI